MAYNKLKDFFRILSPDGTAGSATGEKDTDKKTLSSELSSYILSPTGIFYPFDEIESKIATYMTTVESDQAPAEKEEAGKFYHAIGDKTLDFSDKEYWGNVKSVSNIVPDLNSDASKSDTKVSLFVLKSPYISPATRGTEKIDFFLNYIPPVVASRLVPYLDIEFHIKRPISTGFLDTPGIMRFLLGSRADGNLSEADKLLARGSTYDLEKNSNTSKVSVSGMEMFLMPQSLTNMNSLAEQGLGKEAARLVRSKPFVPFASIESFDVTIQNAGAGAFAHKKASLKMKIHDKSRIGEMSEFFRGEVGFSQAIIWTTYGWIAPRDARDRGEIEEYSKFINENMLIRESWQVVNPQFSFDQSGQVSLNLDMVASAAKTVEGLTVSAIDEKIKNFHKTIKWMQELKKKATPSNGKLSIGVTSEQVLNAASSNGVFKDIKDLDGAVKGLISSLLVGGNITQDDADEFNKKISELRGDNSAENFNKNAEAFVKQQFEKLATTEDRPDPFLPVDSKKEKFFPGDKAAILIKEISDFKAESDKRNKIVEKTEKKIVADHKGGSKTPPKGKAKVAKPTQNQTKGKPGENVTGDIALSVDVVSFGKLFTQFVVPSVVESRKVDELQILFYQLNDRCGPMAGLSIAEFPVNVKQLAYAYNAAIKRGNIDSLSAESFLRLVIETQFVNKGAIGYGMNRYYKITEEDGKRVSQIDENDKDTKDGLEKWVSQFGSLTLPIIEMYIETGEKGPGGKDIIGSLKKGAYRTSTTSSTKDTNIGGNRNTIMRIHIYDRANNPHALMQKIVNSGNGLEVGEVSTEKLKSFLEEIKRTKGIEAVKKVSEALDSSENAGKNYREALLASGIDPDTAKKFDIERAPGLEKIVIPRDRKEFKNFLLKAVPSINIGTNGSMVLSSNVASKTDGTMGAINLMNAAKGLAPGNAGLNENGLNEANGLPLRVIPVQVTMSTMGVPTAQIYQTYFINFDTGTSLDNIYSCSQIQHSISQGKFTTSWTFIYTDGYGKFGPSQTVNEIVSKQAKTIVKEYEREVQVAAEKERQQQQRKTRK